MVHIVGNGCDRRLLDSQKISDYFRKNDCLLTQNPSKADFIFVNTCAMSQGAEDTSINLVKKYQNHKGEVIVHGCLPQVSPKSYKSNFNLKTIDAKELEKIDDLFPELKYKFATIPDPSELAKDQNVLSKFINKFQFSWRFLYTFLIALKFKFKYPERNLHPRQKNGAYLQISSGCSENCSFCAIPRAIGKISSKPLAQISHEYSTLLDKGHREFVFTADNIGMYGLDNQQTFADLVHRLHYIDQNLSDIKWTINELHPKWIIKYLNDITPYIKKGKIIDLCVPIQSGNDRILSLMRRGTQAGPMLEALTQVRQASPKLILSTDVIIGYPSETVEDFLDTIRLITKVGFNHVLFFEYDHREETMASQSNSDSKKSREEIIKKLKIAMKQLDLEGISYTYQ